MKDTQHTPGPWEISEDPLSRNPSSTWCILGFHQVAGFHSPQECQLATVFDVEANARLIAAAPDLLNLMTAATRLDELTGENLAVYARTFAALARAAIARATGNQ